MLDIPVIFIIFNRPETTALVFEKIRQAKPKKLYIVADAPRENYASDFEKCKSTRSIIENIDWDCIVKTKFATINLGCGINVSSGISWVFEHEEMAIILEDDCIPALPFFNFCQELLIKYKDDSRVMHIGGTNWHPDFKTRNGENYFFSKDAHIWGWATWKRAWDLFDYEMCDYPVFIGKGYYKDVIRSKQEQKYFKVRWDSFYNTNYKSKDHSNWDYQWYYTILKNNGLCIWPSSNLISNIGFVGTHTDLTAKNLFFKNVDEDFKIEKHPDFILQYTKLDEYHYWRHKHRSLIVKIYNRLRKIRRICFEIGKRSPKI
jgi:hypothetical protein